MSRICLVGACAAEPVEGRRFNIVGEEGPGARDDLANMCRALGRSLCFPPRSPAWLLLVKGTIWQVGAMLEKRDSLPPGMVALQAVARAWVIDAQATA